jgi:hypothetical protein
MAYALLSRGHTAKAVAMFEDSVAPFPESPNVHDSPADKLVAAGRTPLALENSRTACRLAGTSNDPRLATFRKHRERLAGKVPAR